MSTKATSLDLQHEAIFKQHEALFQRTSANVAQAFAKIQGSFYSLEDQFKQKLQIMFESHQSQLHASSQPVPIDLFQEKVQRIDGKLRAFKTQASDLDSVKITVSRLASLFSAEGDLASLLQVSSPCDDFLFC